jgi:lipid-binding SYLF domain-containing protein
MSQPHVEAARMGHGEKPSLPARGAAALSRRGALALAPALALLTLGGAAEAATAADIDRDARSALDRLYRTSSAAKALGDKAKGILVFPSIVKGGFVVGGQYGQGALMKGGTTVGYYNIVAASIGWQIGAQSFSQAWFFMTDEALQYLDRTKGFEAGVDATVAVADVGKGGDLSTTTLQSPIIAFVFGQSGLMAGLSLQGSKVTRIHPA